MITAIIITITAIYFFGCGMSYEKIITIRAGIRAEDGSSPSLFIIDGRK